MLDDRRDGAMLPRLHRSPGNVWRRTGPQPHHFGRHLQSDDPDREVKAVDVIGEQSRPIGIVRPMTRMFKNRCTETSQGTIEKGSRDNLEVSGRSRTRVGAGPSGYAGRSDSAVAITKSSM